MTTDSQPHDILHPLARYREIIAHLAGEFHGFQESFWLSFAAQSAVLVPDSTDNIAKRIHQVAAELHAHASWYQTLASPARFVIAAMLIQHGIPAADFERENQRLAALLHAAGLRHGRFHEVLAVIVLLQWPGDGRPGRSEIERIQAIYARMKGHHRWITRILDLPACAALAQCPESVDVVMARNETIYQQLHGTGIPAGQRLLTAATLLTLTGLDPDRAVERYRRLAHAMSELMGSPMAEHHEPLALLALLDQEPATAVGRWNTFRHDLDLFQAEERGEANLVIAADLAVLELLARGQDRSAPAAPAQALARLETLHTYHLASAILVGQVEPQLVGPVGDGAYPQWPYV
jgi:hypothetical protein